MYANVLQLPHFNLNVYKLYLNKHYVVVNNWKKRRYALNLYAFPLYYYSISTFSNILFYDSTSSATQEIGIVFVVFVISASLEAHLSINLKFVFPHKSELVYIDPCIFIIIYIYAHIYIYTSIYIYIYIYISNFRRTIYEHHLVLFVTYHRSIIFKKQTNSIYTYISLIIHITYFHSY